MAQTLEERVTALETAIAALTSPTDGYYQSKYSGEEIDALLDKVAALDTAETQ